TVQVPSELSTGVHYALLIANGQYSQPQPVSLAAVSPGVLAYADGTLVAQHADGVLVDSARPARAGEVLVTYLVGMGGTDPSISSGAASPSNPLARSRSSLEMLVDGQTAPISFAGLTPGFVGLFQVNFQVPSGARRGTLEVQF